MCTLQSNAKLVFSHNLKVLRESRLVTREGSELLTEIITYQKHTLPTPSMTLRGEGQTLSLIQHANALPKAITDYLPLTTWGSSSPEILEGTPQRQ